MNGFKGVAAVFILVSCLVSSGWGSEETTPETREPIKIAVMPLANYSGRSEARNLLEPRLVAGLRADGLEVTTGSDLRPVLRRYRIRSQGMVGREEAGILARELDLDFLVLGSWDVFGSAQNPELGFSLRVLDLQSLSLVRATSAGLTSRDHLGWLGQGEVDSLGILADKVMAEALGSILPLPPPGSDTAPGVLCAVVELDNLAAMENAGGICSGILVSRLMAAGYQVLEPGYLRELQLDLETGFRGGIDRGNLKALLSRYPVGMVITGTVDVLDPAVGDPATSAPRVALGLRVIDPGSGLVRLTREISLSGTDHDGWFQQGRIHGLTDLIARTLDSFVNELDQVDPSLSKGRHP